jgi:hypothetical protein
MGSVNYIFANTGQTVRLVVQTLNENGIPSELGSTSNWLDGYGYIVDGYYTDAPDGYYPDGYQDGYAGPNDGYYVPVVNSIMFPDLSGAAGYPRPMTRVSVGLYIHGIQLPNGAPAIGTYIASVTWVEPETVSAATVGFGTATLVDGYATVTPTDGLPSDAVLTWSRVTPLGVLGDITIVPGSQTTTGFTLMSSSQYDNSIVNWSWVSSTSSSVVYKTKTETYAVNAARPFGISSVTPV